MISYKLTIFTALSCFTLSCARSCSIQDNGYDHSFDPTSYIDDGWKEPEIDLHTMVDDALKSTAVLDNLYNKYKDRHNVKHGHHEMSMRRTLFRQYLQQLKDLETDNTISWKPRITFMAHMTSCERKLFKMTNVTVAESSNSVNPYKKRARDNLQGISLPDEYDYRAMGAVTSVKQQLGDDCWAYASVTTIEAQIKLLGGPLEDLSTQELVDCVYGSHGKRERNPYGGGWPQIAYKYLEEEKRLGYRADIPERKSPGRCSHHNTRNALDDNNVVVDDVMLIGHATAANVMTAIYTLSPVSVVIETKNAGMEFYGFGPFDPRTSRCKSGEPHAVAIVGYDKDYFHIKNSWGTDWGNQGYFWWVRAPGGKDCGLYDKPSYPLLEKSWFNKE